MKTGQMLGDVGQQFSVTHERIRQIEAKALCKLGIRASRGGSGLPVEQPLGVRGSLKWLQRAVANRPDLLQPQGLSPIGWCSPVAETRSQNTATPPFWIDLAWVGLHPTWPLSGLRVARSGTPWVPLPRDRSLSRPRRSCGLSHPEPRQQGASHERIATALDAVRSDLGVLTGTDWCRQFYQYTQPPRPSLVAAPPGCCRRTAVCELHRRWRHGRTQPRRNLAGRLRYGGLRAGPAKASHAVSTCSSRHAGRRLAGRAGGTVQKRSGIRMIDLTLRQHSELGRPTSLARRAPAAAPRRGTRRSPSTPARPARRPGAARRPTARRGRGCSAGSSGRSPVPPPAPATARR